MEDESGDLIFNNAFYIEYTAYTPLTDVYTGNFYVPIDLWNVTPQPASNVQFWPGFPAIPITGSIIGTPWQGGNWWWDYGSECNPYNVLPYNSCDDIAVGGDYAPLIPYTLYHVTISEVGLPAGGLWQGVVSDLSGNYYDYNITNTSSFMVWLPNGTYLVNANADGQYFAAPVHFMVHGRSVAATVVFIPTYSVTFVASGLPSGGLYLVQIPNWGTFFNYGEPNLTVYLPSGTYSASISSLNSSYASIPVSYTLIVGTASQNLSIHFAPAFEVRFSQSGLPSDTVWQVNATLVAPITSSVGGTTPGYTYSYNTTGPSLNFTLPSGSYTYTITSSNPHYTPSAPSGGFVVAGAPVTVPSVTFGIPHPVTFTETGLPNGTSWWVRLNGTTQATTGTVLSFTVINGTYSYTVGIASGFTPSPATGSVTVAGSARSVQITYSPPKFTVTFTESGLPAGTNWTVVFNGVTEFSNASSIVFSIANGSYPFVLGVLPGWASNPHSGTLMVSGATPQLITFTVVTYSVTFTETGLPAETSWSITLNGTTHTSTTSTIGFTIRNGSYAYTAGTVTDYSISPTHGTASVAGASLTIPIAYALVTYTITFQETGLSSGTLWNVTVGALTVSSTTPTISLQEQNGTYTYTTQSAGSNTTTGIVVVNGASPTTVAVQFSSTSSSSGISTMTWFIIVAVIIIIAIIIIVIVVALMMRGRGGAQKPAPPT
jgi:hypothetical protein